MGGLECLYPLYLGSRMGWLYTYYPPLAKNSDAVNCNGIIDYQLWIHDNKIDANKIDDNTSRYSQTWGIY